MHDSRRGIGIPGSASTLKFHIDARRRWEILCHYSGGRPHCKECGFEDGRALHIDHIDGNGGDHRRSHNRLSNTGAILKDIVTQGFPDGYQILCANCHAIKTHRDRYKSK